MDFHTCRYCKEQDNERFIKYGVRHYAHLRCLHAALTPDALKSLLQELPHWQLKNLPYFELKELGILELVREICGSKGGAL